MKSYNLYAQIFLDRNVKRNILFSLIKKKADMYLTTGKLNNKAHYLIFFFYGYIILQPFAICDFITHLFGTFLLLQVL